MKIVIDKYIPCLEAVLREAGHEVIALEPEVITAVAVANASALFVRTRTRINKELLHDSTVTFVATATIGTDHIDIDYCRQQGIAVASAPGCNAQAVCDYIEEAIRETGCHSIGIVGYGHVGKKVAAMAMAKGMKVVINDPPLGFLDDVSQCDLITFHTPLTKSGPYPTYHLCDAAFLQRCRQGAAIINAARGGVVDEQALLQSGHPFVLDCWEGEPRINAEVARSEKALLVSMHIAGYSLEGKINASQQCLDAFCQHFSLPALKIDKKVVSLQSQTGDKAPGWLRRVSEKLKAQPQSFEELRKKYSLR